MRGIRMAAGLLAAGLLAWTGAARAADADTVRLGRTDDAPAQNLLDDGTDADTVSVYRGGFRAGGGVAARTPYGSFRARGSVAAGYRGGYGGYRGYGGFRGYGYGGYRGYGYGGFRGYGYGGYGFRYGGYGYGGYRGYGWGYRPYYGVGYGFGYGGYYRPYYGIGYGSYYGGYGYYAPCSSVSSVSVTTLAMPGVSGPYGPVLDESPAQPEAPPPAPADATYPYDGGPTSPVPPPQPAPKADQAPAMPTGPVPSVPLEGRAVSLPKAAGKWTYPAYGGQSRRTTADPDRTLLIRR